MVTIAKWSVSVSAAHRQPCSIYAECFPLVCLLSVEKIKVLLDAITAIYHQFKKDKAERRE